MGMIPLGKESLPELDAFVKSETAQWAPVIRNAGLAGSQGSREDAGRGEPVMSSVLSWLLCCSRGMTPLSLPPF